MPERSSTTKPQTASSRSRARPRVLVTGGDPALRRAVLRSLEKLQVEAIRIDWRDYPERLEPQFAAMVIIEPISTSMAAAVAAVRGHPDGKHVALYALVGPNPSPRQARDAYAAGATAVIEWPREKEILAGILAETLGMSVVRGDSSRPDTALSRTVRAHLRLGPRPGGAIRLSTKKGVVTVSGEARSLGKLQKIVETIAAVPGVRQVLTSHLRVAPSDIPDATIKKNISAVVRAISDVDDRALLFSVRSGRVELRGTVPDRAHFHDLLELIANVKGVRDLNWEVTVRGRASESDSNTARRLERALARLHPKEDIGVGVFAGVAVISGRTRSLAIKRAIESFVARDNGVDRVLNKIMVTT